MEINQKIYIKRSDGTNFYDISIKEISFMDNVMGDCIVSCSFFYKDTSIIDEINSSLYIEYRDNLYYISEQPTVTQNNKDNNGVCKFDAKFSDIREALKNIPFTDEPLENTNEFNFRNGGRTVQFYGNLTEFIERINAALLSNAPSENPNEQWNIKFQDGYIDTSIFEEIILADCYITEALTSIYEVFKVPYIFDKHTIYVGTPINELDYTFKFGQGVGLRNNDRTSKKNKIITRIAGYGSSTNIPDGYPIIKKPDGTKVPHVYTRSTLMPTVWVEAVSRKVLNGSDEPLIDYYDAIGSDYVNQINPSSPSYHIAQFEKAYPTIVGATYNDKKIDEILYVPTTNDYDDSYNEETGEYKVPYFQLEFNPLGFDLYAQAAVTGEMTLSMRSGDTKGANFPFAVDEDLFNKSFYVDNVFVPNSPNRDYLLFPDSTNKSITVKFKKDFETFGRLYPNPYQIPKSGDKFVILGIEMPQIYIDQAQYRLDDLMKEYMKENNIHKYEYPLSFSEHFLHTHQDILEQIKTNTLIRFEYNGELKALPIQSINITEGKNALPSYNIKLTDEISVVFNQVGQVSKKIEDLRALVSRNDINIPLLKTIFHPLRGNANIPLNVSDLKVFRDTFFGNFSAGTLGSGGAITIDPTTGRSRIEVDEAYIRLKAIFNEVVIDKMSHVGGQLISSPARMICIKVEETEESYICYFDSESDQEFVIGDQAHCRVFTGKGAKFYWRLVTNIGKNFIELSKTDKAEGSDAPNAGDAIFQLGNRTDQDRQNVQILSSYGLDAPSFKQYNGINNYILEGKEINIWSAKGNKSVGSFIFGNGKNVQEELKNTNEEIDSVKQTAIDADTKAQNAKNRLDIWSNDEIISPSEKLALKQEIVTLTAEKETIVSNASEYLIPTVDYVAAYNNYKTELEYHSTNSPENINIRSDFYTSQTAYYTQQKNILNSISIAAKKLADETKDIAQESKDYINNVLPNNLAGLQAQIDGQIESYFREYDPSLTNYPANEWITTHEKEKHLNDTFTNNKTGHSWRWSKDATVYSWVEIADTATVEALRIAGLAKDTADGKRRVFVLQPTPPYDKGDLWSQGSKGDLMICIITRDKGNFISSDWGKATKYTDDTLAASAQESAILAKETADSAVKSAANANRIISDMSNDDLITPSEKTNLLKEWQTIFSEFPINITQATLFDIDYISYAESYDALQKLIGTNLDDLTTNWSVSGFTVRERFRNYYTERTKLLNKFVDVAKSNADDAKAKTDNFTLIEGGLVLTSMTKLGVWNNNIFTVQAGISGIGIDAKDIMGWFGGDRIETGKTAASTVFRRDGSGYLAKGNIYWDELGNISSTFNTIFIGETDVKEFLNTVDSKINNVNLKIDTYFTLEEINGIKILRLNFPAYTDYSLSAKGFSPITGGGGGGLDEALLWQILGNTGVEQISISHLSTALSGYVLNSDTRLSNARPASDVQAWAKAANKPSYVFSEIGTTPTTLQGYGITDAVNLSGVQTIRGNKIFEKVEHGVRPDQQPILINGINNDSGNGYLPAIGFHIPDVDWGSLAFNRDGQFCFFNADMSGHKPVKASSFIKAGGNSNQLLRADGGVADFAWRGNDGQPTWLWGGNNQHDYMLWNPYNFNVAGAKTLQGYGNQEEHVFLRSNNGYINGPYWKLRYDSSTNNRWFDLGFIDGNGTFNSGLRVYDALSFTFAGNRVLDAGNWTSIVDGRYLPLSGGIIDGSIAFANKGVGLFADLASLVVSTTYGNSYFGMKNTHFCHIYTDAPSFYFNKELLVNSNKVWHAGNDGEDSGLNADELDGYHYTSFTSRSSYNYTSGVTVETVIPQSVNKMFYVHITGNSYGSYGGLPIDTHVQFYSCQSNTFVNSPAMVNNGARIPYVKVFYYNSKVYLYIPADGNYSSIDVYVSDTMGGNGVNLVSKLTGQDLSGSGSYTYTIEPSNSAMLTDNVASATKLETSRNIFGKPFNGEADVTGGAKFVNICIETNNVGADIGRENEINNYAGSLFLQHATANNCCMCIGGGNVGIGKSIPAYKLDVNGTTASTEFVTNNGYSFIGNKSTYNSGYIELYGTAPYIDFHHGLSTSDYTSRIIELTAGTLTVTGNLAVNALTSATHVMATNGFLTSTSNGNTVTIGSGDNGWCHFLNSADIPFFFGNRVEVNGNLQPHTNSAYTLGSTTNRWKTVYANDFNSETGWFRSTGNTGWYSQTYGGGIYMEDDNFVRTYNGKKFSVSNTELDAITAHGGFYSAGTKGNGLTVIGSEATTTRIKGQIGNTPYGAISRYEVQWYQDKAQFDVHRGVDVDIAKFSWKRNDTEIASLDMSGNLVLANAVTANGPAIMNKGLLVKGDAVEIYGVYPIIDFHFNNSTSDFTSRIIEESAGVLRFEKNITVNGWSRVQGLFEANSGIISQGRIHADGNDLYLGNEGNAGYLYVQDIASQDGADNWNINVFGNAYFYNILSESHIKTNGSVIAEGSVSAKTASDGRLKEHFKTDIRYDDKLLSLGLVCDYNYNDLAIRRNIGAVDNDRHTGLIFQNVAEILPQMAYESEDGYGALNYISPDFICTIAGAVQLNTLGIKDLVQRADDVESEICKLKSKITNLTALLAQLKGGNV